MSLTAIGLLFSLALLLGKIFELGSLASTGYFLIALPLIIGIVIDLVVFVIGILFMKSFVKKNFH